MRRIVRSEAVKLPRVHRLTKAGTVNKYHRRTRAVLPNDVPEDHPRFVAAWAAEEAKAAPRRKAQAAQEGTIAAGCAAYLASQSYAALSAGYRPVIRRHVEAIKASGGAGMMADLLPRHIEADLEPLSPAVARSRLKAWRKLGAFWKVKGWAAADVSLPVKGKRMPKTDGHKAWTQEDVDTFRAHWPVGRPQRLALELLQWTGARCSDAVRLGPQMVRGGLLTFKQQKTGGEALVPWPCPDMPPLPPAMVFIVTVHGKPRTVKGFSQWFAEAARAAGLDGLTAHGLRKYRMNTLAEEGASVMKMQGWVGHTTLAEVEEYTRKAERRRAILGTERKQNPVNRKVIGVENE